MEQWRKVIGYEDCYEVSDLGRVKSLRDGHIMLPSKTRSRKGYLSVRLSNGKTTNHQVHRLVAKAFLPNPDNKPVVNHKDAVKTNNRLENLEWATSTENSVHAASMGLIPFTEKTRAAVIKNALKANEGRRSLMINNETGIFYDSMKEVSEAHGLHHATIIQRLKRRDPHRWPIQYA